jgi:hypothetical protein
MGCLTDKQRMSMSLILESALASLNKRIDAGIEFPEALDAVLKLFGSIKMDELVAAYDTQEY